MEIKKVKSWKINKVKKGMENLRRKIKELRKIKNE